MGDSTTNDLAGALSDAGTPVAGEDLETASRLVTAGLTPAAAALALDGWLDALRDGAVARDTRVWNHVLNCVASIKGALGEVKE